MKMLKKLPANVFTLLLAACFTVFVFRGINILSAPHAPAASVSAVMPAAAQQQVNEEPPALDAAAIAQSVRDTATAADSMEGLGSIRPPAAAPADPISPEMENRAFSAAEIEVLQSLAKRRGEIEQREQKIAAREALLSAAEQEVETKIAELNKLRGELESLLGKQQTMEDERIVSLVKIYENMKPKDAAAIFNTLDMDVLLSVISRMSERKSSPVLASMNTEKARLVTIRLAEMRKLPAADTPDDSKAGAPKR